MFLSSDQIEACVQDAVTGGGQVVALKLLGNLLRFNHHAARDRAGAQISAEDIQRRVGERRDRVEREVTPELDPDFVAETRSDRSPEARCA